MGEAEVKHTDQAGKEFEFVFQHAKVMFPTLSIRQFVVKDCTVYSKKHGGVAKYPDGLRLPFTTKYGGFFVLLNTNLDPNTSPEASVSPPVFSRQG